MALPCCIIASPLETIRMQVEDTHWRTIWPLDNQAVGIIDQRRLPHEFSTMELHTVNDACVAIKDMAVRGAPLIGATAAYGLCLAANARPTREELADAGQRLLATRPTAVNLKWAMDRMLKKLATTALDQLAAQAWAEAARICDEDVRTNEAIGRHGRQLIQDIATAKGNTVNLLTHCNAGWLACVDWGTATAAIYQAHDAGIPVHVWVDETRPRNQGAYLTAWELGQHGVPHTVIADNAGGHLMQHGKVDLCIVGTDRTTGNGDVCNKIGTYLKALAAKDNDVPFYVALPSSTIDPAISDGVREVPIEERNSREVTHIAGRTATGEVTEVLLTPEGSPAGNPAFDVTPARLVTGLVTERGVVDCNHAALKASFPEIFPA